MIQEALNLTGIANQTVNVTLGNINNLMTEGLATTATILLNTSMEIFGEAERLYGVVRGLLQPVNEARQAHERAQNQTQQISDLVVMLNHDVNELTHAISINHDRLNDILNTIQQRLDTVYMIYVYVTSVVPTLEQNVTSSQSQLDRIKMVMHINFIMYAINYYFIIILCRHTLMWIVYWNLQTRQLQMPTKPSPIELFSWITLPFYLLAIKDSWKLSTAQLIASSTSCREPCKQQLQ